jgi:hypothetical protein
MAMSYGIVDLSNAGAPIVMLDQAHLCQDCDAITAAHNGHCLRCGSQSLLALANVLNRDSSKLLKISEAAKLFCEVTVGEMDDLEGTQSASAPAEFMLLHEAVEELYGPIPRPEENADAVL